MRTVQRKVSSAMSAMLTIVMLTALAAPSALATIVDPEYTKPLLDPATQNKWLKPIPNALMPAFTFTPHTDAAATVAGFPAGVCGVSEDCYTVSVRQFQQDLGLVDETTRLPLLTTVNGYGTATNAPAAGPFVGSVWHAPSPTIRSTSNRPYRVTWLNELPNLPPPGHDPTVDGGPNAPNNYPYNRIVNHMHGAHVQPDSDGHPEAWYTPGFTLTGSSYAPSVWGPLGTYRYENTQEASTTWYHDHASGLTHLNTQMGMAGFSPITDDNEKCLQGIGAGCTTKILPTDPYEMGFALQDRTFWPDGSIAMPDLPVINLLDPDCASDPTGATCPEVRFSKAPDGHLIPFDADLADPLRGPFSATSTSLEYFGNMPLVNGVVYGKYDVEPRVNRMRFIGGTDSRTWGLQLEDRATPGVAIPFWQIGSEQGFLNNPVARTLMDIMPGERIDVLVDLKGIPVGTKIVLKNIGPDSPFGVFDQNEASTVIPEIMEFTVIALNEAILDVPSPTAATNLRPVIGSVVALPAPTAPVRNVSLIEVTDQYGRTTPTIDNRGFMQMGVPITEVIKLNDVEQWDIINTTVDAHPIHLHLVAFQLIDRQALPPADAITGLTPGFVDPVTDTMNNVFTQPQYTTAAGSSPVLPELWEAGWKDTIACPPGTVTRVKAKFDIEGLYVWHCHILSHEEHDMMRPFTVDATLPTVAITAPTAEFVNVANQTVSGTATDPVGIRSVTVNGTAVTVGTGGAFSTSVTLVPGANTITVVATDNAGNQTTTTRSVTLTPRWSLALSHTQNGQLVTLSVQRTDTGNPVANAKVKFYTSRDNGMTWSDKADGTTGTSGILTRTIKLSNGTYLLKATCKPSGYALVTSNLRTARIAPVIALSPGSGVITSDPTPTVTWAAYAGAIGYVLQTSANAEFTASVTETANLGAVLSGDLPSLPRGVTRYWRAIALIPEGRSVGSVARAITYREPTALVNLAANRSGSTIRPTVTLQDSAAAGIGNRLVYFAVRRDTATSWTQLGSDATDASGFAKLSYARKLAPGSYRIKATFSGGTGYFAATAEVPVTIP